MTRKNFTAYTKNLDFGETIVYDKSFIDNKGSTNAFVTTILEIFDEPQEENPVLIGQLLWNRQNVSINSTNTTNYTVGNYTFFFKNGSISINYNAFNYVIGTPGAGIGTIIYGTGEYLGATGFVEISAKNAQPNPCSGPTANTGYFTFLFTN